MSSRRSPPTEPSRAQRLGLAAVVATIGLALDLVTKAWAWNNLRLSPPRTIVDGWFYLEFGFNTGSAFSLFHDFTWARTLFIVVTLVALAYMARLAATIPTRSASGFVAAGLIASGALGNLHDRLFRVMPIDGELRHGVVDFIKFYYWPGKSWPTFNVADIALVVGVGILLLYIGRHGDEMEGPPRSAKDRDAAGNQGDSPPITPDRTP